MLNLFELENSPLKFIIHGTMASRLIFGTVCIIHVDHVVVLSHERPMLAVIHSISNLELLLSTCSLFEFHASLGIKNIQQ